MSAALIAAMNLLLQSIRTSQLIKEQEKPKDDKIKQ